MELALSRLPDSTNGADDEDDAYSAPSPMNVEVKVNAGVNICGSRNVMLVGGGGPRPGQVQGLGLGQGQGVKRKAEGASVPTCPT